MRDGSSATKQGDVDSICDVPRYMERAMQATNGGIGVGVGAGVGVEGAQSRASWEVG